MPGRDARELAKTVGRTWSVRGSRGQVMPGAKELTPATSLVPRAVRLRQHRTGARGERCPRLATGGDELVADSSAHQGVVQHPGEEPPRLLLRHLARNPAQKQSRVPPLQLRPP